MGIIWHIFCSFLHVHIPGKHEIPFDDRLRACRGFVFVAAACLVSDMGRRQDIRIQSRIQTLFNSILRIGSLVPVRLRVWLYRRTDALRSQACRFGVRDIAASVRRLSHSADFGFAFGSHARLRGFLVGSRGRNKFHEPRRDMFYRRFGFRNSRGNGRIDSHIAEIICQGRCFFSNGKP